MTEQELLTQLKIKPINTTYLYELDTLMNLLILKLKGLVKSRTIDGGHVEYYLIAKPVIKNLGTRKKHVR